MNQVMCTKQDVEVVVEHAFNKEGGIKETMLVEYKNELNRLAIQGLILFGSALLISIIAFTIYVTTIRLDVNELQEYSDSGQLFSQTDGSLLQQQIDNHSKLLENVAKREDLQRVEETLIRLDERIRNQGI